MQRTHSELSLCRVRNAFAALCNGDGGGLWTQNQKSVESADSAVWELN